MLRVPLYNIGALGVIINFQTHTHIYMYILLLCKQAFGDVVTFEASAVARCSERLGFIFTVKYYSSINN